MLRPMSDSERTLTDAEGWNQRYAEDTAKWDLGEAPAVLLEMIESLGPPPAGARRVLVPGSGYGHDALAWARAGWEVTAVDFAPLAVEGTRARARQQGVELTVLQADVLDLGREHDATFDVIWEQTCLCALHPEMHQPYVASMARAIASRGRYRALFWNHGKDGGPPYDISPSLVDRLFPPAFEIVETRPVPAALSRRADEFVSVMRPRSD